MPTKKQVLQMKDESVHYSRENPALYGIRRSVLLCQACIMYSLAPCLHEETDARTFACATEAAKRPYKKKSSCAVGTGVKGVKKVRSAIKLYSYKFSYNVACDIYVTGIL